MGAARVSVKPENRRTPLREPASRDSPARSAPTLRAGCKACFPPSVSALGLHDRVGRAPMPARIVHRSALKFQVRERAVEERTVFQPSAAGSVRPGTRLNGIYEIEKLIAQGGMGEVYRGFNIQTRDIVAIKMIRPEFMNNPEVFELFRREASILHNLTHEAIVRYFVFSVDPDIQARLSGDGIRRRAVADDAARLRAAAARRGQDPAATDRARARGGASARGHPSGRIAGQHHSAGRRRPQGQDHRFRHRPFSAPGRENDHRQRIRRQIQLRLARATRHGRRRGHVQVGYLQLRARARRGGARPPARHERLPGGRRREAPLRSGHFRRRPVHPTVDPCDAGAAAEQAPGQHGGGGGMGRKRPRDRRPPGEPRGGRGARSRLRGRTLAAVLGALIAVVSLAAVGYVFRDDLAQWIEPRVAPTARRPIAAPPPLAEPSKPAACDGGAAAARSRCPERACPAAAAEAERRIRRRPRRCRPPRRQRRSSLLRLRLLPRRSTSRQQRNWSRRRRRARPRRLVELPPATVATPYRAELPAFSDRSGQGLRLAADGLPPGLAFEDLGDGKGVIQGFAGEGRVRHDADRRHQSRRQDGADDGDARRRGPARPSPPPAVKPFTRPSRTSERRRRLCFASRAGRSASRSAAADAPGPGCAGCRSASGPRGEPRNAARAGGPGAPLRPGIRRRRLLLREAPGRGRARLSSASATSWGRSSGSRRRSSGSSAPSRS